MHGVDEGTADLQDFIISNFLYCHNLPLRQVAVEGVIKLMFSIKGTDMADPQQRDVSIAIISHLVIQLFERKYLQSRGDQNVIKQSLNMFFKSFGLYGEQKCDLILAAILRVVYAMFALDGTKKVRKEALAADDDSDAAYGAPEEVALRAELSTLVCNLDFHQIFTAFAMILSQQYINDSAPPEFKIKRPLTVELSMNLFAMASEFSNQTAYTKEVIGVLECVQLQEVDDADLLRVLWYQANQAAKRFVKPQPRLVKFTASLKERLRSFVDEPVEPESLSEVETQKLEAILLPIHELVTFSEQINSQQITLPEEDPGHLHTLREGLFAINQKS